MGRLDIMIHKEHGYGYWAEISAMPGCFTDVEGTDTNPFTETSYCITADPKFVDAANGDFTLASGSPCKNAGILESWMDGAFDLAGKVRVFRDVPDSGYSELSYPRGMTGFIR